MLGAHGGHGFLQRGPVPLAGLVQAHERAADVFRGGRIEQGDEREFGAVGVPHTPAAVERPVRGLADDRVGTDIFAAERGVEGAQINPVQARVKQGPLLGRTALYIDLSEHGFPGAGGVGAEPGEAARSDGVELFCGRCFADG